MAHVHAAIPLKKINYYCYIVTRTVMMHTETGVIKRNGRQNEPGSAVLARCDYLLLRV